MTSTIIMTEHLLPCRKEVSPPCFKSGYSATSFTEDFADTFADAMIYSTAELQEAVNRGDLTAEYFQKVVYVKQLFNQYAGATVFQ